MKSGDWNKANKTCKLVEMRHSIFMFPKLSMVKNSFLKYPNHHRLILFKNTIKSGMFSLLFALCSLKAKCITCFLASTYCKDKSILRIGAFY